MTEPSETSTPDRLMIQTLPGTESVLYIRASSQPVLSEREAVEKIRHEAVALEAKGKLNSVDAIPLRDAIATALSEQEADRGE